MSYALSDLETTFLLALYPALARLKIKVFKSVGGIFNYEFRQWVIDRTVSYLISILTSSILYISSKCLVQWFSAIPNCNP